MTQENNMQRSVLKVTKLESIFEDSEAHERRGLQAMIQTFVWKTTER